MSMILPITRGEPMRPAVSVLLVALAVQIPIALFAQGSRAPIVIEQVGSAIVTQATGGSVGIQVGMRHVSAKSSLELQWIMVCDSTLGIVLDGPVGAEGAFEDGAFRYAVDMKVRAIKAVSAFEVRVLTFDVWKDFQRTLSFSQLEDLTPNQQKSFKRVWGYYGESQVRDHYVSIAYVARVRLADGTTVVADLEPVLKAAQNIQATVTLQDLSPLAEPLPLKGPQS